MFCSGSGIVGCTKALRCTLFTGQFSTQSIGICICNGPCIFYIFYSHKWTKPSPNSRALTSTMSESFDLFCLNAVNQIFKLKTKVVSESFDLSFDTAARFLSRWKVLWQFSAGREDFDNTLKVLLYFVIGRQIYGSDF